MIQWFPGHMAKAGREISSVLPLVDIVFEIVDARIPRSSQNPMLQDIIKNKPRLILLNKCDMADPARTKSWENYYAHNGCGVLPINALSGYNVNKIAAAAKAQLSESIKKERGRGISRKVLRAVIIGIPNVGKSTLINRLVKRKSAAVGNRPGVTKAQQWIRLNPDLHLLDTPGILWPKFDDKITGFHLALTGAIKGEVLPTTAIGEYFLAFFRDNYSRLFADRYEVDLSLSDHEIARHIADSRGVFRADYYERAFEIIINDFRNLRLGRITLDQL